MTREETVKNLLTELIDMIDNGSQRDLDRADEIAKTIIKALSQEPQCTEHPCLGNLCRYYKQPCDDAISREDKRHIDGFKYWCKTNEENGTITIPKFVCDEIVKILDELPSVTPKPIECDDAISREDALKLIYDFKENHTKDREKHPINYGTLLDLIRLIRELPPVTQKSGK